MRRPEQPVQMAIVSLLKIMGFIFTAPDAGINVASKKMQAIYKAMGRRAGIADLIVWIPGGTLCIEVKKPAVMQYSFKTHRLVIKDRAGTQSDDQKEFEKAVTQLPGHYYMVATSVEQVADFIKENNIKPR